jgi:hypothetical protein
MNHIQTFAFQYQKIIDIIYKKKIDRNSLTIVKKYSVFYTNEDMDEIWTQLHNYFNNIYNEKLTIFLIYNIKFLKFFNDASKLIDTHRKKRSFINFYILENEITNNLISHFKINLNSCNYYDFNHLIQEQFWKPIINSSYIVQYDENSWYYLEKSKRIIVQYLMNYLKLDLNEIDLFLKYLYNKEFDFDLRNYNLSFDKNIKKLLKIID